MTKPEQLPNTQDVDISRYLAEEHKYSSVSRHLPKLIAESDKIIRLTNLKSGSFYVFSEQTLRLIIEDLLQTSR